MEVEDFYTGEKKEIIIPEGCIIIDEEGLSYGTISLVGDEEDYESLNAKIIVDFFPNNPKCLSDIPLYKSSKAGQFKVVVIKDKYFEWVDLKKRQKRNETRRGQSIKKQQAVFDKKGHLRLQGDIYRKESKLQQAIDSYNLALQVEYKTLNKWFKLYCLDEDLQSLDGLIIISRKLKDFVKEREYLERAISLSSLNSRHEEYNIKFKHRLEILLGTYKQKEIPPESHMDVVYTDLINYREALRSNYKKWDYYHKLILKGKKADGEFDYKTAADIYERLIAAKYDGLYQSHPYDRLMALYFNYKMYEDEVRIITLAINDLRRKDLEKRLVAAKKRLQKSKKKTEIK